MAETTIRVILEGQDKLTPTVTRAKESVDKLAKSVSMMDRLGKLRGHLDSLGNKMILAGGGLAAGLGLHEIIRDSAKAEHSLAALANIANLGPEKITAMQLQLNEATKETNQSMLELIGGVQTLMGKGWDDSMAMKAIAPIGKAATASLADVGDLSRTVFAAVDNIKVPVEQTTKLLDVLADAGKQGSFELRDMAKHFPALTAQANLMQISGVSGASQIAAGLQIAMKGAGDADEAANNMKNFLTKITAPTTAKKFANVGVNLEAEFNKGVAGGDVIGHMVGLIQKLTGGNQFKVGQLFEDVQVKAFLAPMMQNLEEYRKIQRRALGADGVLEKDYQRMMGTFTEQWKRLKIVLASTIIPAIDPWLKKINEWLRKMDVSKIRILLGSIAGLLAGGLLMKVASGFIGMAEFGAKLIPVLRGITLQSMLAAWPIALIALGGYLVYKHWDKVGPIFEDIGTNLGLVSSNLGDVLGLMGHTEEIDKLNGKLKTTETIAVVIAKALGAISYGLATITSVQKGAWAGVTAYTPGSGLYSGIAKGFKQGGLFGGMKAGWQGTTGRAINVFGENMERAKDPLNFYGTVQRAAKAQAPSVVQGGPVTVNVNGAKDPKATADEVGDYLRKNNIDIARMLSLGLATADRGAF